MLTDTPGVKSKIAKQILATYFSVRMGTGVTGAAFPFVLWFGGKFWAGLPLQDSMSAYYFATLNGRSMRDWFVGLLFSIGISLYLYKGFTHKEDIALNLAGVMAVCVAVFPMQWNCGSECHRFSVHGACAVILFVCMAFVAVFCADDTLQFIDDPKIRARYKRIYVFLGIVMLASPLMAFALISLFHERSHLVFAVEAGGILAFAAYWLVKSKELTLSQVEARALRGEFEINPIPGAR